MARIAARLSLPSSSRVMHLYSRTSGNIPDAPGLPWVLNRIGGTQGEVGSWGRLEGVPSGSGGLATRLERRLPTGAQLTKLPHTKHSSRACRTGSNFTPQKFEAVARPV